MSTRGELYQKLLTYFVAQVFGRFVLLVGVLAAGVWWGIYLAMASIVFKIGFAGGHIWAAGFTRGLRTISLLWFLVYIKVGPISLASRNLPLICFALISTLVGIGCMGVSLEMPEFLYWRGLLGASWLWLVRRESDMWYFFVIYRVVILWLLCSSGSNEFYVFSFAGVPPLALFFGKVAILSSVSILFIIYLIGLASWSLVYYSRWLTRSNRIPMTIFENQTTGIMLVLLSR